MTQETATSQAPSPENAPANNGSPMRLGLLLLVMVAALGSLLTNLFVFGPDSLKKSDELLDAVNHINSKPIEGKGSDVFATGDDVRRVLGRQPTRQKKMGHYLKEYYCWWGPVPIPSSYITVVYDDLEGKRYKTHVHNDEPEEADLPIDKQEMQRLAREAEKSAKSSDVKAPDASAPDAATPPGDAPKSDEPKTEAPQTEDKPATDETNKKPVGEEPKSDARAIEC